MHETLLFDIFEPQRGDVMSTGGVYLPLLNKVGGCAPQRNCLALTLTQQSILFHQLVLHTLCKHFVQ